MTCTRFAMLLAALTFQVSLLCQAQTAALDVFLLVENSGTMRQSDPALALPGALSAFATGLPGNSQLGILMFDKDARIVLELSRTNSERFGRDVSEALSRLNYRGSRSDLAGGVERAIYELRQQGRPDAKRAIVFVSDGIMDLGGAQATEASSRWLREDLAAEARRLDISVFAVMVSQAADYQLALSLTRATGGEYFRALAPSLLSQALTQVSDRLKKQAESVPTAPVIPTRPRFRSREFVIAVVFASAALMLVIIVVLGRRRKRSNARAPQLVGSALEESDRSPSLAALRDQGTAVSRGLAKATELLTQTNSGIDQFQGAVERYALSNYNELEEAEGQCIGLARECVLLLDYLDIMIERAEQEGVRSDSLRAARSRLCNVLEDAQIEEIPVKSGDVFDSAVQVATCAVNSIGPEGLVATVGRKGYAMKVRGRHITLRAAEVTVTSTDAGAQTQVGGKR